MGVGGGGIRNIPGRDDNKNIKQGRLLVFLPKALTGLLVGQNTKKALLVVLIHYSFYVVNPHWGLVCYATLFCNKFFGRIL